MSDPSEETIAALLREREGYVRRGLDGRVAQVDAQLGRLGHKPKRSERAVDPTPRETRRSRSD